MSVDRRELHELIDSLPDDQVQSAAEDLRRRAQRHTARRARAFAWVGKGTAKDGITDLSTNPRHLEGFGRDFRVILFDTGPIVAAAVANDDHHHTCEELLTSLRLTQERLLLPATVAAEVGYLLSERVGPALEVEFLRGVADGDFEPVDLTPADYERMAELTDRYDDLPLGTTDASIIAAAERLEVTEVATLDRRHFTTVRPRHVHALTLLPERI